MNKKDQLKIIDKLAQQFHSGFEFIKKKRVTKGDHELPLNQANWFLLMGSKGAGKTTLLANSELNFLLSKKDTSKSQSFESNWWVTRDAVILDIPAGYLASSQAKIWRYFLKLLKKYSFQKCLDGILVVLTLEELQASKNHSAIAKTLTKRLNSIQKRFKHPIPVTFIFNKFDYLPSFSDFFYDIEKRERQQVWGIHFQRNSKLLKLINDEFNHLTQRLHSQLVWRIEQEKDPHKIESIQQFPDTFSTLKTPLTHFFKEIKKHLPKNFHAQGVYFTSAHNESSSKALATPSLHHLIHYPTGYFIHDLLDHTFKEPIETREKQNLNQVILFASGCVGFLVLIAFVLAVVIGEKEKNLQLASQALSNYQASQAVEQNKQSAVVSKAQALQTASQALSQGFALAQPNNLQAQLHQTYQNTLASSIFPQISQLLMKSANDKNLSNLLRYQSLAAYLMLTQANSQDAASIASTVTQIANAESVDINLPDNQDLESSINLLTQKGLAIPADKAFIKNMRAYFASLDRGELALLLFKNNSDFSQPLTIDFSKNPSTASLFDYQNKNNTIPALYTAQALQTLTPTLLYEYVNEALYGNAALGTLTPGDITPEQTAKTFIQTYTKQYNQAWENYINNITFKPAKNLNELDTQLSNLASPQSGLSALFSLINTNLSNNIQLDTPLVSIKNTLNSQAYTDHLQTILTQLQVSIHQITSSDSPAQSAFNFTAQRFSLNPKRDALEKLSTLAEQSPTPINQWLNILASTTWQLLVNQTQQYISQQYQQTLYQPYSDILNNDYPFSAQSDTQTSMQNFEALFNPNGTISHFFETYVQPFLDTSKMPWQPVSKDGQSINFSSDLLQFFMNTEKLQAIFFPNQSNKPSILFNIQPTNNDTDVQSITFLLGKQQAVFESGGNLTQQSIAWPDLENSVSTSITFIDQDNQPHTFAETGPWALMKLLLDSQMTQNPHVPGNWIASFSDTNDSSNPSANIDMTLKLDFSPKKNPFQLKFFEGLGLPQRID